MAFLNGDPAITIYIKPSQCRDVQGGDLSILATGAELLHEYTHVVQYDRLGFTAFGKRYAAEFRASGYDADRMYAFRSRGTNFDQEMIEGQAAIVGRYAEQIALDPSKRQQDLIEDIRRRLRGTGIYGL